MSPERGLPGSEFEAVVRVTNDADNLGAVRLAVSAPGMEVVSAGSGLPVQEPNQVFDFEAEPGRVRLVYVTTGVFNGPADVFRVRFRVPEGAVPGVVAVTVSEVEVVDGTNTAVVPAGVTGASFEVLPVPPPVKFRGEGRIAIANGVLALGATQGVVNLRGISLKNLSAIDLTVRFDPQIFVPRKDAQGEVIITPGPQAGPGAVASAEEIAPGQLRIAIVSPTTFTEGSGLLATLEVEPPQGQRFQAFRFSNLTPVSARALDDQNLEADFLANIFPGLLIVGAESKPGQGWILQTDVPITSAPSLAVVNNRAVVMFGTSDGRLIVRTAKENDPAFEGGTRDTVNVGGGAIVGRPTVRDGGIYVSTEGGTVAFIDAVGGNVRWRAQLQAQGLTAPVVIADSAGKQWVFVGDNQGRLHKLDAATGQPAQGSPASVARGAILTSPAAGEVAPGVRDIWVADAQGFLTGVNLENLTVKQQFQFQGPLSSAPFITSQIFSPSAQVVDRLVALGTSGDGVFVMVNPRTLQTVLTVPTESSIVGPIFIDTDANFVPTFGYATGINRAGGSSRLVRVNLSGLDPAKVNDPAGRLEVIASDLEGEAREAVLAWAKAGSPTYAYVLTTLADGTGRFYGLEARAGGSRIVVNLSGRPLSPSIDPVNNLVFVAFTDPKGGTLVGLPVLP